MSPSLLSSARLVKFWRSLSPANRFLAIALIAILVALIAIVAPQAAKQVRAAGVFDCTATYSIRGVDSGTATIRSVNPTTGVVTTAATVPGIGPAGGSANSLGISSDGRYAYFTSAPGLFGGNARNFYRWDQTTETLFAAALTPGVPVTHGAVDPNTGTFYYGGITSAADGTGTLVIYGVSATNTDLGLVASGTIPAAGQNGDFGFDTQGNLFVVGSNSNGQSMISVVNQTLPTTRQAAPLPITGKQITSGTFGTSQLNGIAFASDGYLYTSTASTVYRIDPATGSRLSSANYSIGGSNDMASCATPGTVTAAKNFDGPRDRAGDQATVSISGGGLSSPVTGTTSGTDTGRQDNPAEQAGPAIIRAGQTVTVSESGSGADQARYETAWECRNLNTNARIAGGSGTSGSFTMPNPVNGKGAIIDCVFTNDAQTPGISVVKSSTLQDENGNGVADAGETIDYGFNVTNTGRVGLQNVSINDDFVDNVSPASVANLAEGASTRFTASYTVTQADVDSGEDIVNTATARGTSTRGVAVESQPSSTTTPVAAAASDISLVKTGELTGDENDNGVADEGEEITYTFTATNTGNTTLRNVSITDNRVTSVSPESVSTLAPGGDAVFTATYTVSQADVDAGRDIVNTATAEATDPGGEGITSGPARANLPVAPAASALSLDKDAEISTDGNSNRLADVGDVLTYTFTVTNTGNTTMRNVTIDDDRVTSVSPASVDTLEPGESTEFTANYTVTQADIDAETDILNTATATGTSAQDEDVTSDEATANTPVAEADDSLAIVKDNSLDDDNGNRVADVGETIDYSFTVTNNGNTTLTDISVDDDRLESVTPASVGSLEPGESAEFTATYTVTQADVDAAEDIVNTATASGTSPVGEPVQSGESRTVTPVAAGAPGLAIVKSSDLGDTNDNGAADAGETIDYTFTVRNTGNVSISYVTIDDPQVEGTDPASVDSLAPGESATFTASYTVTQEDIDAGEDIVNVATAGGTTPGGSGIESGPSETTTPLAPQAPKLSLAKEAALENGEDRALVVGDSVEYTFTVTNSGNTTLTDITISDDRLEAGSIDPESIESLEPGESQEFTALYTVTQDDVDAGGDLINVATAEGQAPGQDEPVESSPDRANLPVAQQTPGLGIEKDAALQDGDGNGTADAGETIDYTITVTNTGNVTMTDVTVDDQLIDVTPDSVDSLAPGESAEFTGTYTVTQADVNAGSQIVNRATASGTPPGDDATPITTDEVTTQTPVTPSAPGLEIEKSANLDDTDGNGSADAGETVTYTFDVTNTGNVTLRNVGVNDDRVDAVAPESVETLAPGDSAQFTAEYTVTEADVAAGTALVNVATATGTTPQDAPFESQPDDATVPVSAQAPALTLEKTASLNDANDNGSADAGETIDYTITVTNSGNVTLTNVSVDDSLIPVTPESVPSLAPGNESEFTGSYTVTQADVDSGDPIVNSATAAGTPPGEGADPIESNEDSTETAVTESDAEITLEKVGSLNDENGNGTADAGETIDYTLTVTNEGNVSVTDISVDDSLIDVTPGTVESLAPGASTQFTGTYTVTQADVDAGEPVLNEAIAQATPPGEGADPIESNEDEARTPVTGQETGLSLEKTASLNDDNGNDAADAGETIDYTVTVRNVGNVTLTDVSVDDPLVDLAPGSVPSLAPNNEAEFTGTYTVTQEDVDAGEPVVNVASATGTPPGGGGPVPSNEGSTETPVAEAEPALETAKDASLNDENGNDAADAGETIDYTITVTNTGNVTLANVTVDDSLIDVSPTSVPSLAPGAQTQFTGTYTVTQADVNSGEPVVNTASSTGTPPGEDAEPVESPEASTETPVAEADPALETAKDASLNDENDNEAADAGETIDYTITVTNTGNVTLANVSVDDSLIDVAPESVESLAPGAEAVFTGTYTVTQADVDAGGDVVNTATSSGTPPGEDAEPVESPEASTETPVAEADPALETVKQASLQDTNGNGAADAGEAIDYTITVTNTGNVTLTDVSVDDELIDVTPASVSSLAPDASASFTGTYTVTQEDVDSGEPVVNTASAAGTPPGGGEPVESDEAETETPVADPDGSLALEKTASLNDANDNGTADAGETIDYTITVTNTGNVTLTDVSVDDSLIDVTPASVSSLAPNANTDFTGTYTVTQEDVDAGEPVVNTATAEGTPPGEGAEPIESNEDSTETTVTPAAPELTLEKRGSLNDENDNGTADAGETIDYTIVVTNSGNVTVTDISVDDSLIDVTPDTVGSLAPQATTEFTGTYTVTQADVDAGEPVVNQATAQGTPPGEDSDPIESNEDEARTPVTGQETGLSLEKTASLNDENGNDAADAGETIEYTVTVRNVGNVTLTDVSVDDPLVDLAPASVPSLAPNAEAEFTGTYTVTQADVDAGGPVVNTAGATGTPPGGGDPVESNEDTTETPVADAAPELTVEKSASLNDENGNGAADAGETIDYTITVTNTGNVTVTGVSVDDALIDVTPAVLESLAPDASGEFTGTYTVTQADVDAGEPVVNTASASGTPAGGGDPVESNEDRTETPVVAAEADLEVLKSAALQDANDNGTADVGETIEYTFTVTNTGNVTLTDVGISDDRVDAVEPESVDRLAPGGTATFTAAYTVTEADLESGSEIVNVATAEGIDPSGEPVESDPSEATVPTTPVDRDLTLTKANELADGNGNAAADAGEVVTYTFVVTNNGNTTLSDVRVDDPMVEVSPESVESLAPGASAEFTAEYTVTEEDVARGGFLVNVAVATGSGAGGEEVTSNEATTSTPLGEAPEPPEPTPPPTDGPSPTEGPEPTDGPAPTDGPTPPEDPPGGGDLPWTGPGAVSAYTLGGLLLLALGSWLVWRSRRSTDDE